ncbi:MAG: rhodanese-like domain-containing protein [Caldilineales bacterium]|nr:rhodanese-like domain-containing protein [Caldilineales bacterium]
MSRRKQNSKLPYLMLIGGGVLLLITILLWATQPKTLEPTMSVQQPADSHEEETYPEIPRVSLRDAKAAFDGNTAIFLDVRDVDSYASAHIPNALNIPLSSLAARLSELDKNAQIMTYCT